MALAAAVAVVAACGPGTGAPATTVALPAGVRTTDVTIPTPDGQTLTGRWFLPEGPPVTGVLLAHQRRAGKETWYPFAARVAAAGGAALTFDFRGYGGSTGARDRDLDVDLRAAAGLFGEVGVDRVHLVGASMGGTAAVVVAAGGAGGDVPVAGVVTLSAPARFGDLDAGAAAGSLGVPLLAVAAAGDEPYATDARALAAASGGRLLIVDGDEHGTALLEGPAAAEVTAALMDALGLGP